MISGPILLNFAKSQGSQRNNTEISMKTEKAISHNTWMRITMLIGRSQKFTMSENLNTVDIYT